MGYSLSLLPYSPKFSRSFNNKLAQTTDPANLSPMNNGSSRRRVSSRGLPLLVCHFIAEMGIGVLGIIFQTINRHPRGGLVEDPDLKNWNE